MTAPAATFGGARTAMLVGRASATFPQKLFVDLRRAGWPVSPVLEGPHPDRRTIVPPARHRAGDAAAASRQRAGDRTRRSAILRHAARRNAGGAGDAVRSQPDGRRNAVGQAAALAAAAARAAAARARRARGRYRHRAADSEDAGSGFPPADRQEQGQARSRWKRSPATNFAWSSPMRRPTSNASPTVFISI